MRGMWEMRIGRRWEGEIVEILKNMVERENMKLYEKEEVEQRGKIKKSGKDKEWTASDLISLQG
jgi:hypothetical protein